jgi:hypothetical protein
MAQIFHRSMNAFSRATILGFVFILAIIGWMLWLFYNSSWATQVDVARDQPVQFSHEHHVAGLGIDCRYCHTSVEDSSFAGVPATEVCMQCHSIIWSDSPKLAPVRESFKTGKSLQWTRVHDVPDYAYFNHVIHVKKGIGCATCHGKVNEMPLMWREETLHMKWCLDCHRDPARHVRPRERVFSMTWKPEDDGLTQAELGSDLIKKYHIDANWRQGGDAAEAIDVDQGAPRDSYSNLLVNCSICHR